MKTVAIIYQLEGIDTFLHVIHNVTSEEFRVLEKANGTCLNSDNSCIETEMVLAAIDGEHNRFDDVGYWQNKWPNTKQEFPLLSPVDAICIISWY